MAYRIRQGREFVLSPAGLSYTGQCVVPRALPRSPFLTRVCPQIFVPDGSPWPGELQAVARAGEGARRAVPSARRSRTQRELHNGASDRQFTGGSLFCCRVSGFCVTSSPLYVGGLT